MAKFIVLFSSISDAAGNSRLKGDILDVSEIADVPRFLEIGAIAPSDEPESVTPASTPEPVSETAPLPKTGKKK